MYGNAVITHIFRRKTFSEDTKNQRHPLVILYQLRPAIDQLHAGAYNR
jgi:hypothetical protein